MLLKRATLEGIRAGRIRLAFRRWKRPTVKAGGTLLTSIGQLAIERVDLVELHQIDDAEARAAGFPAAEDLRQALLRQRAGSVYRIALGYAGPDPRIALRERRPDPEELEEIRARLGRMDAASRTGPWTRAVIDLVGRRPEVRAADLCNDAGMDRRRFKANVRKLKALGLTESLRTGYRLSPRGRAVRRALGGRQAS